MRLIDADGVIEEIKRNKLLAREPAAAMEEPEEQLPGQMAVSDYPGIMPEVKYREIQEEENAEGNGNEERTAAESGDDAGMSDGAGMAGDAVEPGITETMPGEKEETEWMKIQSLCQQAVQYLTVWEGKETCMENSILESVYRAFIDLAAAVESIMIIRQGDK